MLMVRRLAGTEGGKRWRWLSVALFCTSQAWLLRQAGEILDAVAPAAVALDTPHTIQATVAAVLEAGCLRSEDTCVILYLYHAIA